MRARYRRYVANGVGVAIIVVVIVLAFVLSDVVLNRNAGPKLQHFSAKCAIGSGNGTGMAYGCAFNATFGSGSVLLNWTVTAGNATSVQLSVNSTVNNTTTTIYDIIATHSGTMGLTICNASLPHKGLTCQAPPGNVSFEFSTTPGSSGWANYRLNGYFQAKSQ